MLLSAPDPSLLQGRKGDLLASFSVSDFSGFTSLLICSSSLSASNLNLFLGARHIGDSEVRLLDTGEAEEDLEVGEAGLGEREYLTGGLLSSLPVLFRRHLFISLLTSVLANLFGS